MLIIGGLYTGAQCVPPPPGAGRAGTAAAGSPQRGPTTSGPQLSSPHYGHVVVAGITPKTEHINKQSGRVRRNAPTVCEGEVWNRTRERRPRLCPELMFVICEMFSKQQKTP